MPAMDGGFDGNGSSFNTGIDNSGGCACTTTGLARASMGAMGFGSMLAFLLVVRRRRR
jgi:hypothetical protein